MLSQRISFPIAHAQMSLYPPDMYHTMASCINVSIYASISPQVAFVVGLHAIKLEISSWKFLAKFLVRF